jgi:hypothetical protein
MEQQCCPSYLLLMNLEVCSLVPCSMFVLFIKYDLCEPTNPARSLMVNNGNYDMLHMLPIPQSVLFDNLLRLHCMVTPAEIAKEMSHSCLQ